MKKFKKILIMGLPGSGKTTLAQKLAKFFNAERLNADEIRKKFNDFDFSEEGRLRQSRRMKDLAEKIISKDKHAIVDFICPTPKTRKIFNADITIWLDTIESGRFEDTNKMFINPDTFDFRVTEKDSEFWSKKIAKELEEK
tara:strand:- start:141 stop:563 length:423 start_codon:yes stop_codon:yes gene_type:complete